MKENKERTIHSRIYKLSSGKRYYFFLKKKIDRLLTLEIVNNKGEVDFKLMNKTSGETLEKYCISTGMYEFNLLKGNRYCFVLAYKKASGKTKMMLKNL